MFLITRNLRPYFGDPGFKLALETRYTKFSVAFLRAFWEMPVSYFFTPRSRVLIGKLTGLQLVKKFPKLYRNPKVHYRIHN